jgi:hypothetical protein
MRVLSVINDVIRDSGARCLPSEMVNLDLERHHDSREGFEQQATDPFESPPPQKDRLPVEEAPRSVPSIFRYFMDGSRRTYKVTDFVARGRYLPLIAGQVGVAVLERADNQPPQPLHDLCKSELVIAFPDELTPEEDLKMIASAIREKTGKNFRLLRYQVKKDRDPVDLGVAKIMAHMASMELGMVDALAEKGLLRGDSLLAKDGPLRYKNLAGRGFDVTQFRNVVGLSKTFRPSFSVGKGKSKKDVGVLTFLLKMGERTQVFRTPGENCAIGVWFLRLRPRVIGENPLQGVIKAECYAVSPDETESGLNGERIRGLTAFLLRERNVTPYGADSRWASHLYPIYLAETFIKSNFLSDICFEALF